MHGSEVSEVKRAARVSASRAVVLYLVVCSLWILYAQGLEQVFTEDQRWLADLLARDRWVLAFVSAVALYVLAAKTQIRSRVAEHEAVEAHRALSTFVGNLPGLAFRASNDFARTMQFVSQGCSELTGYRAEDLVDGRRVRYEQLIHPDDAPLVFRTINEALDQHRSYRVEYRIRNAAGDVRWVLEQGCGLQEVDGRYLATEGLMVDVTRMKSYERQLEEQHEHLEEIVSVRTAELSEANQQLMAEVERRRRLEEQLRELSTRDPLTGLYNRREMERFLREELARCNRYGRPLSVVMIDLDHFKKLNDTYGHQGGDDALRWTAGVLRAGLRTTDRAVRYGGEEMALILTETDGESAWGVADRLRKTLAAEPVEVTGDDGRSRQAVVTMSAGVASFPADGTTMEQLLASADAALYAAKRSGRNRVCKARVGPCLTPLATARRAS